MSGTYLEPPTRPAPATPGSYSSSYRSSYAETSRRDSVFSFPSAGSIDSIETPVIEEAKIVYITPKRPTLRNVHSLYQHYRLGRMDRKNSHFSDDSTSADEEDEDDAGIMSAGALKQRKKQQQGSGPKSEHSPYSWYNRASTRRTSAGYGKHNNPRQRQSMIVKPDQSRMVAPPVRVTRSITEIPPTLHEHSPPSSPSSHERNPSLTSSGSAASSLYSSSSGDNGRVSCETMSKGETQELWTTMVELQDEYGCYDSERIDAAVKAESEAQVKQLMPNRFVIDILNDSIQDLPPEAWDRLMRHLPVEDPADAAATAAAAKKAKPKETEGPPTPEKDAPASRSTSLKRTPAVRRQGSKDYKQTTKTPTPPTTPMSPMSPGSPVSPKTVPSAPATKGPSTSGSPQPQQQQPQKKKSIWKRLQHSVEMYEKGLI